MPKGSAALPSFSGKAKISSADLVQIFRRYDVDGSGSLESSELDRFLSDVLLQAQLHDQFSVERLKNLVMEHYDKDRDGKIQLNELEEILPTQKNFLLNFHLEYPLTSVEFMTTWCHYDTDHSGYLDKKDIMGFLKDLLSLKGTRPVTPKELEVKYTDILYLCDDDNDGRISVDEFKKLVKVEENHLKNIPINDLTYQQYSAMYDHYDKDGRGKLGTTEVVALIHDIHEKQGLTKTYNEQRALAKDIMTVFDKNKDGYVSKSELALMFPIKR